jgi:hypothetical protein
VLQELGEKVDPSRLLAAAEAEGNLSYAQRAGWLLDKAEFGEAAERLAGWLEQQDTGKIKLDPAMDRKEAMLDKRWNIWINTTVEGDL